MEKQNKMATQSKDSMELLLVNLKKVVDMLELQITSPRFTGLTGRRETHLALQGAVALLEDALDALLNADTFPRLLQAIILKRYLDDVSIWLMSVSDGDIPSDEARDFAWVLYPFAIDARNRCSELATVIKEFSRAEALKKAYRKAHGMKANGKAVR